MSCVDPFKKEKEKETMSDTLENEMQPSETVTPQELRESLLTELEIARQTIVELSNEQLEEVVGGAILTGRTEGATSVTTLPFRRTLSAPDRLQDWHFPDSPPNSPTAGRAVHPVKTEKVNPTRSWIPGPYTRRQS
jgi:hypothetical protein